MRDHRMRLAALAAVLFALACPAAARADEITLKGGRVVYGFIKRETSRQIFILRMDGRTERIDMSRVEAVIEGTDTGDAEFDAKIKAGESLASIAQWAKEKGNPGFEVVALMAVRANPEDSEARELLGHQRVAGVWYEDPKEAAKARQEMVAREMRERGLTPYKDGWISAEDRRLITRNPNDFVLDDEGVWRDKAAVMTERGYVKLGDKWVKAGTPQDTEDIQTFKQLIGEDIFVLTTKHFRLYIQQYPADQISEFSELVEKVYDWFLQQMNLPPDADVFRGNKGHMWVFRDKNIALEWYKNYRNRFSLSDDFGKLLQTGGGNIINPGILINSIVPNQRRDIKHDFVNHAAQFLLYWFSRSSGEPRSWLYEGFGVHAEHEFLENGFIVHSTLARYGGDGGRADKEFATKDAPAQVKAMVRERSDEALNILNKIELNSLTGEHIAKAYTMVRWWMQEHRENFVKWLRLINVQGAMEAIPQAFGDEWTHEKMDREWRDMVRKKF